MRYRVRRPDVILRISCRWVAPSKGRMARQLMTDGRLGDRRHVVGPGRKKFLMKIVMLIVAVVLIVIGAVWALQGLGVIGGSAMSGNSMWAIIGPILVVVGLGVGLVALRRGARRS